MVGSFQNEIILSNLNLDDTELENLINDIFNRTNVSQIVKIDITNNSITKIPEIIKFFPCLTYLDLSRNQIQNIASLSQLKNLEVLILSNNKILNIWDNLYNLNKLHILDLSYNKLIVNSPLIKSFKYNLSLVSLSLKGNTMYNFSDIKLHCLENLRSLTHLDGLQIISPNLLTLPKGEDVYINTLSITGESNKVKKVKDYIKLRRRDIKQNTILYNQISERNLEKIKSFRERSVSPKSRVADKSSYYFFKLNFKNKILI
jgi:Leucine-rich repeat (LRR) protein